MVRTWNPLWSDLWPVEANGSGYDESIKRSVLASINWIEAHPNADLQWLTRDMRPFMQAAGIPDDVDPSKIMMMGFWSDFIKPSNDITKEWFDAIVKACENGNENAGPTIIMMRTAMSCGKTLQQKGWDAFNLEMLSLDTESSTRN